MLESAYIKEYREKRKKINEGAGVSTIFGKGKEAWLRRKKTRNIRRRKRRVIRINIKVSHGLRLILTVT